MNRRKGNVKLTIDRIISKLNDKAYHVERSLFLYKLSRSLDHDLKNYDEYSEYNEAIEISLLELIENEFDITIFEDQLEEFKFFIDSDALYRNVILSFHSFSKSRLLYSFKVDLLKGHNIITWDRYDFDGVYNKDNIYQVGLLRDLTSISFIVATNHQHIKYHPKTYQRNDSTTL